MDLFHLIPFDKERGTIIAKMTDEETEYLDEYCTKNPPIPGFLFHCLVIPVLWCQLPLSRARFHGSTSKSNTFSVVVIVADLLLLSLQNTKRAIWFLSKPTRLS